MSKNLRRYQWQIGDLVFGKGTVYSVLGVNPQSYNVVNQDTQVPLSDEITMAQDAFQPMTITFTIGVRENEPMRYIPGHLPCDLVEKSSKLLTTLQKEWKADEIKQQWGQLKPIVYTDGYGSTRRIYGRPRKFSYIPKTETSQFRKVTAEFARADTLTHADVESQVLLVNNADPKNYTRDKGDAPSWYRVLLVGPMVNPLVTVGANQIQLQHTIASGVTVEVSSYPWSRRIIDSNDLNLRTTLVGSTKYLDQLQIPPGTATPMTFTATGLSGASKCLVLWRDAYHVI